MYGSESPAVRTSPPLSRDFAPPIPSPPRSLELPEDPNSSVPMDISNLLRLYFREETVDKACEACGATGARHMLRHSLHRLPRVLALHLKRFRVAPVGHGGVLACQKLHTPVGLSDVLRLGPYLAEGARPPLPLLLPAVDKENQACTANRATAGAAGPAAPLAQRQQQELGHGLRPQLGASFYSNGSGGRRGSASPMAAAGGELLSPLGSLPRSSDSSGDGFLRSKRATSLFYGLDRAQEERDLERALELSLAEERQRQQQQQETATGGLEVPGSVTAAAVDADDEQLQRALALSLAEQVQREQQQQQQAAGVTVIDLSYEALAAPLSSSPTTPLDATLAVLPAGASGGKAKGSGAAQTEVSPLPLGPTYEIVEDDWEPPVGNGASDSDDSSHAKVVPIEEAAADLGLASSASAICGRACYSLQAVVTHRGGSAAAGHFIADARDSASCAWFRHDDSVVTRISQKDATCGAVAERGAYLLFYMDNWGA